MADEEYSFIGIENESHGLVEDYLSMTNSPITNEALFTSESDVINELLIDGMQCEIVSIL